MNLFTKEIESQMEKANLCLSKWRRDKLRYWD